MIETEPKKLEAKNHVDLNTGFRIRYVKSESEYFRPHSHDYYEIFLALSDNIIHIVNGDEYELLRGNLLFVRDFDIHDYKSGDGKRFEFLNLSFTAETLFGLFDYLGDGINKNKLLSQKQPPQSMLLANDTQKLFYSLLSLGNHENDALAKAHMRALLADVFVKHFSSIVTENTDVPLWLEMAYEKMKNPKNFIRGAGRFVEMTGKSREHASRKIKEFYGETITEYVNELRLEYAVNLMKRSNLCVADICYECGFSNLSWFYELFSDKYGKSPAQYRAGLRG